MSRFITTFLMVISLTFSPFQGLSPIGVSVFSANEDSGTGESIDLPTIGNTQKSEATSKDQTKKEENIKKYKASSFVTLDFEGYCTIEIPESHFKERDSSTSTQYELEYKDNKSRLTMSYVTNIGSDADIPGYITREVAGVNTTTNNKVEETYGNNIKWMKVPAEEKVDGCNVYVYYTLNENKSAAFWCRAKVAPDSDGEEFFDVLRQIFDTYQLYGSTGSLFETPKTGLYEGSEETTKGDTSNYKANTLANQVFSTRGGYIPSADISADWSDLEIILDGTKFQLPCTLDDFYKANFEVNDKKVTANNMTVEAGKTLDVQLQNDNGTVVIATLYNSSLKMSQSADDCKIMRILVDSDRFLNVTQTEKEAKQREREEAADKLKQQMEDAEKEKTDDKAEGNANKQFITIDKKVNIREKPNAKSTVYKESQPGEKFEYIRMSDDSKWYCVKYEDHEAFIRSTYGTLGKKGDTSGKQENTSGKQDNTSVKSNENQSNGNGGNEQQEGDQQKTNKKQVIKISRSVPLKSEPQLNARKITALTRGETFDYLDVSEDGCWYKIDYFGKEAWVNAVAADLVELSDEDYEKEQEYMKDLYGVDKENKNKQEALKKADQQDDNTTNQDNQNDNQNLNQNGDAGNTSEKHDESYDEYGHQMILAGGVTWPVYVDDAIAYYGTGVSNTKHNNGQQLRLQWTKGEKYMTLITGNIKQIYSVELSCVPTN